jgi:hypothetical protein
MMKRFFAFALVVLILAACGGGDDDSGVQLQVADVTADPLAVTNQTASASESADWSAADGLPGGLAFVQGHTLYLYPHAGAAGPVAVAEQVDATTIRLTPKRDSVIYTETAQYDFNEPRTIQLVNLSTFEQVSLSETFGEWHILDWSPDGEWALIQVVHRGLDLARLDGTHTYEIARTRLAEAFWLTDGTILVLDESVSTSDQTRYKSVIRFDPATGESIPLEIDLNALADDRALLDTALADLGVEVVQRPVTASSPSVHLLPPDDFSPSNPAACAVWQVAEVEGDENLITDVLYQGENVYQLSDLQVLPDGSLLFLQWTLADCRVGGTPSVTLLHLVPGQPPQTVIEDVFPGVGLAAVIQGESGRYAVSPDGHYVACVNGNAEAGISTLRLVDLQTGQSSLLADAHNSGLLSDFIDTQLFSAVYWVQP